jgi:hypothetical protein
MTKSTDTILDVIKQNALVVFPSGFTIGKQSGVDAIQTTIRIDGQGIIPVKANVPMTIEGLDSTLKDKISFESIFEDNAPTVA